MTRIKLPNGATVVSTGTPEQSAYVQKLIDRRHAFVLSYCRSRGWPERAEDLSIDQIMEIREQPGWQHPIGDDK